MTRARIPVTLAALAVLLAALAPAPAAAQAEPRGYHVYGNADLAGADAASAVLRVTSADGSVDLAHAFAPEPAATPHGEIRLSTMHGMSGPMPGWVHFYAQVPAGAYTLEIRSGDHVYAADVAATGADHPTYEWSAGSTYYLVDLGDVALVERPAAPEPKGFRLYGDVALHGAKKEDVRLRVERADGGLVLEHGYGEGETEHGLIGVGVKHDPADGSVVPDVARFWADVPAGEYTVTLANGTRTVSFPATTSAAGDPLEMPHGAYYAQDVGRHELTRPPVRGWHTEGVIRLNAAKVDELRMSVSNGSGTFDHTVTYAQREVATAYGSMGFHPEENGSVRFWIESYEGGFNLTVETSDHRNHGAVFTPIFALRGALPHENARGAYHWSSKGEIVLAPNWANDGDKYDYGCAYTSQAAYDACMAKDEDADGLTTREEHAKKTDPSNPDTDGDGVNDKDDKWPLDPARHEGFSYACEGMTQVACDASDADGDGLTTASEREKGTDPDSADTDGDGYPDGDDKDALNPAINKAGGHQVVANVLAMAAAVLLLGRRPRA